MSERDGVPGTTTAAETVPLGDLGPARSRHAGRRSAVCLDDDRVAVGTADGTVRAFDRTLTERFVAEGPGSVVALTPFAGGVAAGERGPDGGVRLYDADGTLRRRVETAADVGAPTRDSRFYLPYVAAVATGEDALFAAARRYERDGDDRQFDSCVYGLDPDGTVRWRYRADASPIALSARDDRVAVAYNRCPARSREDADGHEDGLVVLDAATGAERWTWDPPGDGDRRVGDVALLGDGAAVASHADYRGYRVDDGGVRWSVDLATPRTVGDERLYAYPNHVHATEAGVVFVTGNTYPAEGRETEHVHPDAHAVFGYDPGGRQRFRADHGGFAGEVGTDGERFVVPAAQAFRVRDPDEHGWFLADVRAGPLDERACEGVPTAAAVHGDSVAVVEEPVVYHDEGVERGAYRLHLRR